MAVVEIPFAPIQMQGGTFSQRVLLLGFADRWICGRLNGVEWWCQGRRTTVWGLTVDAEMLTAPLFVPTRKKVATNGQSHVWELGTKIVATDHQLYNGS
jgi:hypothetical protein